MMENQFICLDCKQLLSAEMLILHSTHKLKDLAVYTSDLKSKLLQAEKKFEDTQANLDFDLKVIKYLREKADGLDFSEKAKLVLKLSIAIIKKKLEEKKKVYSKIFPDVSSLKRELLGALSEVKVRKDNINNLLKIIDRGSGQDPSKALVQMSNKGEAPIVFQALEKYRLFSKTTHASLDIDLSQKLKKSERHRYDTWLEALFKKFPFDSGNEEIPRILKILGISERIIANLKQISALFSNGILFFNGEGLTDADLTKYQDLAKLEINSIFLNDNKITEKGLEFLIQSNPELLSKLQALLLSGNLLENYDFYVFTHLIKDLAMLDLSNIRLNNPGAFVNLPFLNTKHLKLLNLSSCGINPESLNIFSNSLEKHGIGELKTLLLDNNEIDDASALNLVMQSSFKSVDSFSLKNNKLTPEGIRKLVLHFTESGGKLQSLVLSGNKLDNHSAVAVGKFARRLNCILINNCDINDEIFSSFIAGLYEKGEHSACKIIGLNGNPISDKGLMSLIDEFEKQKINNALKTLFLNRTKITEKSICNLIKNGVAKYLFLNEIPLTPENINTIFEQTPIGKTKGIHFCGIKIGDSGMKAIVPGIIKCTLKLLNLTHTDIGDEGIILLGQALDKKENSLLSLHLDENPFSTSGFINFLRSSKWSSKAKHITILPESVPIFTLPEMKIEFDAIKSPKLALLLTNSEMYVDELRGFKGPISGSRHNLQEAMSTLPKSFPLIIS